MAYLPCPRRSINLEIHLVALYIPALLLWRSRPPARKGGIMPPEPTHLAAFYRCCLRGGPLLLLVSLSACGSGPDVVRFSNAEQELTFVAMAYGDAHAKLGRGPKNSDELKPFLKTFGDPDDLLISPNDGQPYVVVWGLDPSRGGPTDYKQMFPILAYETTGSRGKRAVTDVRGRPMMIPQGDFSKLTFAGRHKPAS